MLCIIWACSTLLWCHPALRHSAGHTVCPLLAFSFTNPLNQFHLHVSPPYVWGKRMISEWKEGKKKRKKKTDRTFTEMAEPQTFWSAGRAQVWALLCCVVNGLSAGCGWCDRRWTLWASMRLSVALLGTLEEEDLTWMFGETLTWCFYFFPMHHEVLFWALLGFELGLMANGIPPPSHQCTFMHGGA